MAVKLLLDIDYCVEEIKRPLDGLSTLLIDYRNIQGMNTEELTTLLCNELFGKTWIYTRVKKRNKNTTKKISRRNNTDVSDSKPKSYKRQKEYKQPIVICKLCNMTVHKDDAMWGNNHRGYICHKCIEKNHFKLNEI